MISRGKFGVLAPLCCVQPTAPPAHALSALYVQEVFCVMVFDQRMCLLQGAVMRGLPGLLCKLLKDELPTNRPLPELLFVSLLEDRLPRKVRCICVAMHGIFMLVIVVYAWVFSVLYVTLLVAG
jgi:hypothetical protein